MINFYRNFPKLEKVRDRYHTPVVRDFVQYSLLGRC